VILDICGYAILPVVASHGRTLRAVVGALLLRLTRLVWLQLSPEPSEVNCFAETETRSNYRDSKASATAQNSASRGGIVLPSSRPNGCGKSNISDAISWVARGAVREESPRGAHGRRDLRRHRDRKPLGMAYVTMTLVDPDLYNENTAHSCSGWKAGIRRRTPRSPSPAASTAPAKANT